MRRAARAGAGQNATSASQWLTGSLWVGFFLVVCTGLAWFWLRHSAPSRRIGKFIGKQVVLEPSAAPVTYAQSPSASSPIDMLRVQNPPQALTFVLELRQSVEEFYEEKKCFQYGVVRIFFDTDNNSRTGGGGRGFHSEGFEAFLDAGLMAEGYRSMGDWANAHQTIGRANRHVISSKVLRVHPQSGAPLPIDRKVLERGKVDGKYIWLTVSYSDLEVVPGQTLRVTILDEGANQTYGDGEMLPSFQLTLK